MNRSLLLTFAIFTACQTTTAGSVAPAPAPISSTTASTTSTSSPPTTAMALPTSSIVEAARPPSSRGVNAPVPGGGAADHDGKEHVGDVWEALAQCESGMRPGLRNPPYSGAFQFMSSTWRSLGYSGEPADHSYEVQKGAAIRLQARSGWGQWPTCSRKLGLR